METLDPLHRLRLYATSHNLIVGDQLGFGVHGTVFSVYHQTEGNSSAVKIHERERDFIRERDVYLRLHDYGITEIRGCTIPALLDFDNDLLAIQMSIVDRPYVLDFGGAFLDQAPAFSDEVLAEWHAEKRV